MSKILITGGAGFVGYFLCKRLLKESKNKIVLVDNLMYKQMDDDFTDLLKSKNVELIEGDLTDLSFYESLDNNYDYIYHLAAVKYNFNNPKISDKILFVNSLSVLRILEFTKKQKNLKNFMFSSTGEVYAGTQKHYGIKIPTDENVNIVVNDLKEERTSYALTKIFGESACFNYGKNHGIPFIIIRFHNLYGPRMGYFGLIPDTFKKISENNIIDVYGTNYTRDFTYIEDAVEMVVNVCNLPETQQEIYNVGSPAEEITIKDLVMKIANVMNRKIEIIEKPDTSNAPTRRCADTKKLDLKINYERKINLEQGLKLTYDWYKRNNA